MGRAVLWPREWRLLPAGRRFALGMIAVAALAFALAPSARAQSADAPPGQKRIALLIGNSEYRTAPLRNPVNDARALSEALKTYGFEVFTHQNVGQKEMKKAVIEFGKRLREAGGVGLFFFAGHGMQVNGKNYMIPVDAEVNTEAEVDTESVDVDYVLARMEGAKNPLNIVILDACRDNPFARRFRSTTRGLASIDAPLGTLIAYATAPGKVAADGDGVNGLYTGQLLKVMGTPGLRLEDVFKRVRQSVQQQTRGDQVPWESSSLTPGDFFFVRGSSTSVATPGDSSGVEATFWESIRGSSDPEHFREYLQRYPNGHFRSLASNRMQELERPKPGEIERLIRLRFGENGLDLRVDVSSDGIVTLTGVVKSQEQKARATSLARVPGVKDVRSQINVQDRWRLQ